MSTYSEWIEAFAHQHNGFVRGTCKEAAEAMTQTFPELRLAAGFVHCDWGRDQHWWCVTSDGQVVDPTAAQFQWVWGYEELDLSDPEAVARIPTGVCADCGADVYHNDTFCSEACERATMAYLNSRPF